MHSEKESKLKTKTIKHRGRKNEEGIEAVMRSIAGLHCSTSAGDISSASGSQPPTTHSPSSSVSLPLISLPFALLVCVWIRF